MIPLKMNKAIVLQMVWFVPFHRTWLPIDCPTTTIGLPLVLVQEWTVTRCVGDAGKSIIKFTQSWHDSWGIFAVSLVIESQSNGALEWAWTIDSVDFGCKPLEPFSGVAFARKHRSGPPPRPLRTKTVPAVSANE